jgi:hypothetical protein
MAQFQSQSEFWDHYVRAHRSRTTRRLHFVGTSLAIACLVAAAVTGRLWLVVAAPVIAYAFAWLGHFRVEGNTPATFANPWRSIAGDARMFWLMCRGRMEDEVRRVQATSERP